MAEGVRFELTEPVKVRRFQDAALNHRPPVRDLISVMIADASTLWAHEKNSMATRKNKKDTSGIEEFEPKRVTVLTVFKTAAFNHSAIPPLPKVANFSTVSQSGLFQRRMGGIGAVSNADRGRSLKELVSTCLEPRSEQILFLPAQRTNEPKKSLRLVFPRTAAKWQGHAGPRCSYVKPISSKAGGEKEDNPDKIPGYVIHCF